MTMFSLFHNLFPFCAPSVIMLFVHLLAQQYSLDSNPIFLQFNGQQWGILELACFHCHAYCYCFVKLLKKTTSLCALTIFALSNCRFITIALICMIWSRLLRVIVTKIYLRDLKIHGFAFPFSWLRSCVMCVSCALPVFPMWCLQA